MVREHKFPANKAALERFISGIPNSQITIAIEACGIWRGAYKTLSEGDMTFHSNRRERPEIYPAKIDEGGRKLHSHIRHQDDNQEGIIIPLPCGAAFAALSHTW